MDYTDEWSEDDNGLGAISYVSEDEDSYLYVRSPSLGPYSEDEDIIPNIHSVESITSEDSPINSRPPSTQEDDSTGMKESSLNLIKEHLLDLKAEVSSLRDLVLLVSANHIASKYENPRNDYDEDSHDCLKKHRDRVKREETSITGSLDKLMNENSSLQHQLEYLKAKDDSSSRTILELQSEIAVLKAGGEGNLSTSQNVLCLKEPKLALPLKNPQSNNPVGSCVVPPKKKPKAIPTKYTKISNKRLKVGTKEGYKLGKARFADGQDFIFKAYFDQFASVSICPQKLVRGLPLTPLPIPTCKFGDKIMRNCLGVAKVSICESGKEDNLNNTAKIYVFNEAQAALLCRKDWNALLRNK